MTTAVIRDIAATDHPAWLALWDEYCHFYRVRIPPEVTAATWQRLMAIDGPLHGLVAERDGQVIGFTFYLFHASSWSLHGDCYLEDLYVAEASRGGGAARELITEVYARADRQQAGRVYWQTQQYNAPARALYDTLANVTSNVQYERRLPPA